MNPENKAVAFLKQADCLIVEPSPSFSANIQSCLTALGADPARITIARKFEDARRHLEAKRHQLLITEYELDGHFGLALAEIQEKMHDEMSRIAIIVSKNSSDSAVAEAAEGQVDAFILKPFSPDVFNQKLNLALDRKTNPSEYMLQLNAGKKLLTEKQWERALTVFSAAKALHPKPVLACYYCGVSHQAMSRWTDALAAYREGRQHQALHYKCLTGEFETLMGLKRYQEAHALIELLKSNYPLTPRRLAQIFMASIFSLRFDEILSYYDLFTRLDQRSAELVRIASLALYTAGRHYLGKDDPKTAVDLFDRALLVGKFNPELLDKCISELLRFEASDEAQLLFSKVPAHMVGTPEHNRLSFKIDQVLLGQDQLIERGRKLVMDGQGSPEVYQIVVRLMGEAGKDTLAESVIQRATNDFPELRAPLYKLLQDSLGKAAS